LGSCSSMITVALEAEANKSRRSSRQAENPSSCSLQSGRAAGYFLTDNFKMGLHLKRGLPEMT
jgi:hypothetical protein